MNSNETPPLSDGSHVKCAATPCHLPKCPNCQGRGYLQWEPFDKEEDYKCLVCDGAGVAPRMLLLTWGKFLIACACLVAIMVISGVFSWIN